MRIKKVGINNHRNIHQKRKRRRTQDYLSHYTLAIVSGYTAKDWCEQDKGRVCVCVCVCVCVLTLLNVDVAVP